ncbi:MAG: DNA double-strand break repair nuclease NurA, partial [Promethearchaeota archaeon]
ALVQAIRLVYNYTYPTPKFERETNLDILGPLDILETNEQTQLTSVQNEPINTKRFLMEIKLLENAIKEYAKKFPETTSHFFLDGTLIPTFIQSYSKEHKKQHIKAIKSCLDTSKANVRPILGYIDSSSAKDVLSLIKIVTQSLIKTDLISDATLLEYYIRSKKGLNQEIHWGDRTCAFICERNDQNYKNLHENKETYKIAFFYIKLNSGQMARVEFPTWCLKKDGMVEEIAQIVRNQSAMGNGYPYIIDKCHHEAIITAKDRMKFLGMFQEFCKKNNINFKIYNKFRSKLRSNYIS